MIFHRHKHEWGEVGRVFCPGGQARGLELAYTNETTVAFLRLIYGVTVIEEHCPGCASTREVLLTGNHVP